MRAFSTAALFTVLAGFVAWFGIGGAIHRDALRLEATKPNNVTVVAVDGDDIVLEGGESVLERPGIQGLEWDGGYVHVANPRLQTDEGRREMSGFVVAGDLPPPAGEARVDGYAFAGEPSVAYAFRESPQYAELMGADAVRGAGTMPVGYWDVEYASVERNGEDTPLNAWVVRPLRASNAADTWVILVHGKGGTRAEGYRILPTLTDLGYTVMLIAYRDDRESAQESGGEFGYGRREWRDVVAAMQYAAAPTIEGIAVPAAERVILYGFSMGGGIVASTIEHEDEWPAEFRGDGLAVGRARLADDQLRRDRAAWPRRGGAGRDP